MSPPPPGRAEERTDEGKRTVIRTDQKNRHDELTRAGNYAALPVSGVTAAICALSAAMPEASGVSSVTGLDDQQQLCLHKTTWSNLGKSVAVQ